MLIRAINLTDIELLQELDALFEDKPSEYNLEYPEVREELKKRIIPKEY